MCDNKQVQLPDRSEFQDERAVILKLWEPTVVQTTGTDNRLVLQEH